MIAFLKNFDVTTTIDNVMKILTLIGTVLRKMIRMNVNFPPHCKNLTKNFLYKIIRMNVIIISSTVMTNAYS